MTPAKLAERWAAMGPTDVLEFYGHNAYMGDLAYFSNFFDQSREPFDFEVPEALCAIELPLDRRVVPCEFSEKAIMMCKAAAMGDRATYLEICATQKPAKAKQLGRQVRNFDNALWNRIVCSVAFHVVFQKFRQSARLQEVLLATGERVIAEATRNDKNWGIGVDRADPRARDPSSWQGTNILGWALMEARTVLRAPPQPVEEEARCGGEASGGVRTAELPKAGGGGEAGAGGGGGGGGRPAFLLYHGCFNPVHRQHLEMMAAARKRLEDAGYRVVRGLMAIAPAACVLQQKSTAAVSDGHRLAALRLGCQAVSGPDGWLRAEPRGVHYDSASRLAETLGPELLSEEPGAIIFEVMGADAAVRSIRSLTNGPTIVVGHQGSTEASLKAVKEAQHLGRAVEIFVAEELAGLACSSTRLRQALAQLDVGAVQEMCPTSVAEYLLANSDALYGARAASV